MMMIWTRCLLPLVLMSSRSGVVVVVVDALYVSYETPNTYRVGESLHFTANKLTSPATLAAIDYPHVALCNADGADATSNAAAASPWHQAVASLHGDAYRSVTAAVRLPVGQDLYCASACEFDLNDAKIWRDAIRLDYSYNVWLDGLPASSRTEDAASVSIAYWGGIPVGQAASTVIDDSRLALSGNSSDDVFYNNHWNIQVAYKKNSDDTYSILHTMIDALSFQLFSNTGSAATGKVRFTYDVTWSERSDSSYSKRWEVFLSMDGAVPTYVEFAGCALGLFILAALLGSLVTWILRDFSYKPVVDQQIDGECTEEETAEIKMWPLSTRIFFPPTNAPVCFCIACGTGAQLLATAFVTVVLFRAGIISQSQGAKMLTPGLIIYALCSAPGGYVTGRLYAIFHGELVVALASCLATAIAYPLAGMLVSFLVYDRIPGSASPNYNVMANGTPLVLLWIFFIWPLTVVGGFLGHRAGPIQNFPVSEGSAGYQDLNLQDNSENTHDEGSAKRRTWASLLQRYRITILFATGGVLPVLSSFVGYSYVVAGPTFLGSYSLRSFSITSYLLFVFVSGAVAVLQYYRQIRTHIYQWWWAAFAAAGSSGLYIFVLSVSYMLFRADSHIAGSSLTLYVLWFAYISVGITLMTGFVGVATCMVFNRTMYTYIMKRQ